MEPPLVFTFPFEPYDIQKDFMKNLFEAIEKRKIGIFESPTGTGKSMSIICGSLTWLRDNDKLVRKELAEKLSDSKEEGSQCGKPTSDLLEPDWVSEFARKQDVEDVKREAKVFADKLTSRDRKMKRILEGIGEESGQGPSKKRIKYTHSRNSQSKDETLLLLEQAKRELENRDKNTCGNAVDDGEYDSEIVLEEYHSDDETECIGWNRDDDNEDDDDGVQKIYYCSRTHSQLSQFIREVQKSPFAFTPTKSDTLEFFAPVVPLASRQSLCINQSVKRLWSVQQMNDKCLDMQKNSSKAKEKGPDKENESKTKKKSSGSCPFKSSTGIDTLSEKIIGKVQDIEEIVKIGKEISACPYYAARRAISFAQLIVVPYQMLLHSSTRKASGMKLKESVVIVDEAHNLVDTISNIHSIEVTCSQVQRARNQLVQYARKFSKRLTAENLMYVKRILFILKNLLGIMGINAEVSKELEGGRCTAGRSIGSANDLTPAKSNGSDKPATTLMTIHDFLFKANLDNINIFKVLRYCARSMISKKLNGFVKQEFGSGSVKKHEASLTKFISKAKKVQAPLEPVESVTDERAHPPMMQSPLMHIENFLLSLTSANEDGRIVVTASGQSSNGGQRPVGIGKTSSLKFLLLNPAMQFKDIVEECRAVIVAGGTMQPSSSFVNQLLAPLGVPKDRIFEFSCGHVIGKDQLLPVVLSQGPARTEFEFTFDKRRNVKLIDELGRALCNVCNIVPGGIVCFFPSYDYEKVVYSRWSDTGILKRIEVKKKIFREPRKSSEVDKVLREYSTCIQRSTPGGKAPTATGALLLSVVGGKMSEGINFSDDLGRCVVMVGLPYPNLHSAELKEKMAYLNAKMPKVGSKSAGQSYYENLCMKAVNQSIGRAIRHKNDHACIVLADRRYARSDIKSQLPGWISDKLQVADGFATAFGAIRTFFSTKTTSR